MKYPFEEADLLAVDARLREMDLDYWGFCTYPEGSCSIGRKGEMTFWDGEHGYRLLNLGFDRELTEEDKARVREAASPYVEVIPEPRPYEEVYQWVRYELEHKPDFLRRVITRLLMANPDIALEEYVPVNRRKIDA